MVKAEAVAAPFIVGTPPIVNVNDGKVAAVPDVPTHFDVVVTAVRIFAAVSVTLTELVALDPLAK